MFRFDESLSKKENFAALADGKEKRLYRRIALFWRLGFNGCVAYSNKQTLTFEIAFFFFKLSKEQKIH